MTIDVIDLRDFLVGSASASCAAAESSRHPRALAKRADQRVLGLGYPTP